jgi:hypothetical protein
MEIFSQIGLIASDSFISRFFLPKNNVYSIFYPTCRTSSWLMECSRGIMCFILLDSFYGREKEHSPRLLYVCPRLNWCAHTYLELHIDRRREGERNVSVCGTCCSSRIDIAHCQYRWLFSSSFSFHSLFFLLSSHVHTLITLSH